MKTSELIEEVSERAIKVFVVTLGAALLAALMRLFWPVFFTIGLFMIAGAIWYGAEIGFNKLKERRNKNEDSKGN